MARELDKPTLRAWRSFLTAHALMVRRIDAALLEEGLPPLGWYDVLWAVHSAPEHRLRINELADAVVLSRTGMSRMVDRLVEAGLLRREAVPEDRRGAYAAITDAGVDQLRAMWPVYARAVREHFKPNLADPDAFRETLDAVAESARGAAATGQRDRVSPPSA
jgi:DNA-binding MarR family transcriptional regulator